MVQGTQPPNSEKTIGPRGMGEDIVERGSCDIIDAVGGVVDIIPTGPLESTARVEKVEMTIIAAVTRAVPARRAQTPSQPTAQLPAAPQQQSPETMTPPNRIAADQIVPPRTQRHKVAAPLNKQVNSPTEVKSSNHNLRRMTAPTTLTTTHQNPKPQYRV